MGPVRCAACSAGRAVGSAGKAVGRGAAAVGRGAASGASVVGRAISPRRSRGGEGGADEKSRRQRSKSFPSLPGLSGLDAVGSEDAGEAEADAALARGEVVPIADPPPGAGMGKPRPSWLNLHV